MKYLEEFRRPDAAKALLASIHEAVTQPWTVMEVCGGQTHSIVRHGIDELLPADLELVHGPGCPVCVTPLETIDRAHAIAQHPGVVFCSFGDMLRVPGSETDLLALKSLGCDVRVVYSPLDAVELAAAHPEREVVFFAIGFETTAPANATAAWQARRRGLDNFSLLVSHVLVPPVLDTLLTGADNRVQGFLGPGHVCTVMGTAEYEAVVERHGIPIVVTGFEPVDLLDGLLHLVRQLEDGRAVLENCYRRVVSARGNGPARDLVAEVFEPCDRPWRGLGTIGLGGLRLRAEYAALDAERRFGVELVETREDPACIAGEILKGNRKPPDCAAFGTRCTPLNPLGATMVSSEGACAAYYACGRAPRAEAAGV